MALFKPAHSLISRGFLLALTPALLLATVGALACTSDDRDAGASPAATAVAAAAAAADAANRADTAAANARQSSTGSSGGGTYPAGPTNWEPQDVAGLPRVTQTLVAPPALPEHQQVAEGGPKVVEIRMEVEEKELEIAPGVFMWAFTFNGSVPGPIVVVHEGDYVELTLVNPTGSQLLHNIDFHAAVGALGGGDLTKVGPGQEVKLRFRAVKPGVFIYHCAPGATMVPWHVTHGMNGAIMVLPRDGLKDPQGNPLRYDRAYYIGEQDYYIPRDDAGNFKRYATAAESLPDDLAAMSTLIPTHIVFNGVTGALQGDGALTANVGETVLIVHSQANRQSYPHLIGGHGDYVWERGAFNSPPRLDLESWVIAAGSAGASLHQIRQPGTYVYLSHNLIEAFAFDAKAILTAEGEWNNDLMEQISPPGPIQ